MLRNLFLCSLILLASCGKDAPAPKGDRQQLRVQLTHYPETFDPREVCSLNAVTISKMLFEGLTRIGPDGQPQLALAERVEISSDGKQYRFFLRQACWSDGKEIEAQDFVYAWHCVLNPERPAPYANMLYPVVNARAAELGSCPLDTVGITAIDETTLVIDLERPLPYFLELTAFPITFPIPRHVDQTNPAWTRGDKETFVNSGPFAIEHVVPSGEVRLRRNLAYWDLSAVQLDELFMPVISDDTTAVYLFEQSDLDWVGSPLGNLPSEVIPTLKTSGKLGCTDVAATLWYKLNTERVPLNNAKVRRALAYAINRQEIVDHVVPMGQQTATSPVPYLMGLRDAPCFKDGDTDLARELFDEGLQELGLTRASLPPLVLTCSCAERYLRLAQAVQQQWRKALGIQVKIEMIELNLLLARTAKQDYMIAGKMWLADYNDPTSFLNLYKQKDGMNETGWTDHEFTRLITLAEHEVDLGKRNALLRAAEEIIVDQMPVIPLYYNTMCYLKSDKVQGVCLSAAGFPDFKWSSVE